MEVGRIDSFSFRGVSSLSEPDVIEIYLDEETHELYYYIPASGQIFILELGEELDELPESAKKLLEINFTDKTAYAKGIEIPLF